MSGRLAAAAALGLALLALAAAAALARRGSAPADFSGRWRFANPDAEGRPAFPLCAVEIRQEGDRADLSARALDGGAWTCTGRAEVTGGTARLRWAGTGKGWRGTATLRLEGDTIRGTYRREDAAIENLACVGVRE